MCWWRYLRYNSIYAVIPKTLKGDFHLCCKPLLVPHPWVVSAICWCHPMALSVLNTSCPPYLREHLCPVQHTWRELLHSSFQSKSPVQTPLRTQSVLFFLLTGASSLCCNLTWKEEPKGDAKGREKWVQLSNWVGEKIPRLVQERVWMFGRLAIIG